MRFGLTPQEFDLLNTLLIQPLKDHSAKVWIFGSRARGDHAKFSDIDILYALPADAQHPPGFLFEIRDALENSNLPYKVDVVSEAELAVSYRDSVLRDRVAL